MKFYKVLISLVLPVALLAGCSENSRNVMIGDTVVKFAAPPEFCLAEMGYPLHRSQLGVLEKAIAPNLSVFAVYTPCERKIIADSYAFVFTATAQINSRFRDPVDQWARNMADMFENLKATEFERIQREAESHIKSQTKLVKDLNSTIVESYYDELAAYITTRSESIILDGGKVDGISYSAISLVKGKPLGMMVVRYSFPDQANNLSSNDPTLELWVKEMHDVN